jgi:hypothetical protein
MPRKKSNEVSNDEKFKVTKRKKKSNEEILQENNIELTLEKKLVSEIIPEKESLVEVIPEKEFLVEVIPEKEPVVDIILEKEPVVEVTPEEKKPIVEIILEEKEPVVEVTPEEKKPIVEVTPEEKKPIVEIILEEKEPVVEVTPEEKEPVVEVTTQKEDDFVLSIIQDESIKFNKDEDLSVEIKSEPVLKDIEEDNIIKLNKTISYTNLTKQLNISKINLLNTNEDSNKQNIIKGFTLDNDTLNNILEANLIDNIIQIENNYSLSDLQNIFKSLKEACMIIDINDGIIKYIEKKGNESRNQSVIDLLLKANNYRTLPNVQFIIFTNDFIDKSNLIKYPYLLTFCRNNYYKTNLFPNFNFNHWLEANIGSYEEIYNYFTNNQLEWNSKSDILFWSGANTNPIRQKISDSSKKYKNYFINILDKNRSNNIPIENIVKNKYLLNMNGYSYGGRLNYLFLSGSCVIILKNMNEEKCYEEFFYKEFIPNTDYIEILYSDNENGDIIINRINDAINNNNCEMIAKNCYLKAKNIFKMSNIYDYIHDTLNYLASKNIITNRLEHNLFLTPSLNYFFKERLLINNNNIDFNFKGNDFEINIYEYSNSTLNIKIKNNITKISYNNKSILEKYTPYIVNNNKIQKYKIIIDKNNFAMLLNDKFNLINALLPSESFNGNSVEIKTDSEGLWIV